MSIKNQILLENLYSKKNTVKYMRTVIGEDSGIEDIVDNMINDIEDFEVSGQRPDISEVMELLYAKKEHLYDWVYDTIAYILAKNGQPATIQELAGINIGKFYSLANMHRKLMACSILVTYVSQCKYIKETVTKGQQTFFESIIKFPDEIMSTVKKQGYVLPSIIPLKTIKSNSQSGYYTFDQSVLLGGKHHDKEVCLSHINRVNNTPYQYEDRLPLLTEPVFNPKPKVKKDGQWETEQDIQERFKSFRQLHDNLPQKLAAVRKHSDTFYLGHGYCTRGRTYSRAYEYNYQGSAFLKAMIDFAELEVIESEW